MLEIYDLETDEKILLHPHEIKKEYKQKVEEHYDYIKEAALKLNFDYLETVTLNNYSEILTAFLNKRVKLA